MPAGYINFGLLMGGFLCHRVPMVLVKLNSTGYLDWNIIFLSGCDSVRKRRKPVRVCADELHGNTDRYEMTVRRL